MTADMVQGKNSYDTMKYGGPAPPDKPHTYITTVYALDYRPELDEGFSQDELLLAIDGHVLATAELNATYPN